MNIFERFEYIGVNDPEPAALTKAIEGEAAKLAAVRADPLLRGEAWAAQRRARDPFGRGHDYRGVDPALDDYLDAIEEASAELTPPWD